MKIANPTDTQAANTRFNHFHDGFLRRLALTRDLELVEVTTADGTIDQEEFWNGTFVELEIRHSNYDYPNQPENRLVSVRATACINLIENIEQFLGKDIFDLQFAPHPKGIGCLLTFHSKDELVRSMENGTQVVLLVATAIEIDETLFEAGKQK